MEHDIMNEKKDSRQFVSQQDRRSEHILFTCLLCMVHKS